VWIFGSEKLGIRGGSETPRAFKAKGGFRLTNPTRRHRHGTGKVGGGAVERGGRGGGGGGGGKEKQWGGGVRR